MNKKSVISVVVLLLVGGGLIAYRLNQRQQVLAHNEAVARQNKEITAANEADARNAAQDAPSGEMVVAEPQGFVTATPVAKEDQLKLAEELVAKAGALWKEGKKVESIAAGNAALEIYDVHYGKQDERTVKLRVQITKAKMEVLMPNGK